MHIQESLIILVVNHMPTSEFSDNNSHVNEDDDERVDTYDNDDNDDDDNDDDDNDDDHNKIL